ncbi:LysR family transcriptional regulator [Phyllobacterium sp. YR531]|uniref:LysR family transcriptional regulator n=1 Tax=Phyllobacterium sp. YR531 TaxID=1144343 RepID=UPI00026FCC3E|nr:LysR family transcriptional regulator [Phyllobacterium sp. YR531]EJN03062.1 transcriptional regulator [Phyllobacterium sp. YR531]
MLDALTLDQMRTFVAVAESGSFRAGAAKLLRVQSAVSHSIANLEGQLGVFLFDRSGHRPVLTAEGQTLLTNVRDILLRVDAMRARARGLGEGVELELPLVVDTLFPTVILGKALAEMRVHYPSVAIRVAVEPLGGPLDALLQKRCKIGITVGEHFRDPQIALQALSSVAMVAVVSAEHPLANVSQALAASDLADHLQIVQSDPSPLSEGRDFGVISPQTCRVSNQDMKHALILAGLGWGRLPLWQVDRDLQEKRLVRLATRSLGRDSQVISEAYLAHRSDEPLGPAARALAQALLRLCSAIPS